MRVAPGQTVSFPFLNKDAAGNAANAAALPEAKLWRGNIETAVVVTVADEPGTGEYTITFTVPAYDPGDWLRVKVTADGFPAFVGEATVDAVPLTASGIADELERAGGPLKKIADAFDADGTLTAAAVEEITATHGAELAASIAAQLQLAAVRREGEAGPVISDRTVYRGTTWRIALPFDLPADWTRVEFTARAGTSDDQAASLLHVVVSNPSGADGLQIFNGSADGFAAGDASIATDGSPVVILAAELAAKSPTGSFHYDAKVWNPDGVDQSVRGTLFVEADVTRSPLAA